MYENDDINSLLDVFVLLVIDCFIDALALKLFSLKRYSDISILLKGLLFT